MEGLINAIVNNWKIMLTVGGVLVLLFLFVFVYELNGFFILLRKAVGTVLQKLCSLLIEAICLVFKIINCLEIYVVLLIDALTGKATANGKIASLAIGVLSVASFYTTYTGMESFVTETEVAFLITLGVQAILLSTSLRINENLEFGKNKLSGILMKMAVFLCVTSCIAAYLLSVMQLSYRGQKIAYHILYLMAIVSLLTAVVSLIRHLMDTSMKNRNMGMFLLLIYFAVLSVSSFFSYNAFVPVLYPDSVRNIDTFYAYKVGVVELMDHLNDVIDDNYYESVKAELISEIEELQIKLNSMDDTAELTDLEKKLSEREHDFEDYIKLQDSLNQLNNELEEENDQWDKEFDAILQNSGGIGPNTRKLIEEMREKHEERAEKINQKIEELQKNLDMVDPYLKSNINEYKEMREKQHSQKEKIDCSEEMELINRMLNGDIGDQEGEAEFRNAVDKVEGTRIYLQSTGTVMDNVLNNNIEDMVEVYQGYKVYRKNCRQVFQEIQSVALNDENYQESQDLIERYAYEILQALPETSYIFYGRENSILQTDNLVESNYYSTIESLKRNANPNISRMEKNIHTFVDNKMIGVLCALLALLIDMMILFVGIILPGGITFPNMSQQAYSDEDVKRILSNLFNKPIGR